MTDRARTRQEPIRCARDRSLRFARELFEDAVAALKGDEGGFRPLYTARFDVPGPRPFEVRVAVVDAKNRVALGPLFFAAHRSRRIGGEGRLQDGRRFAGDAALAERLNADKGLLRKIDRFARSSDALGEVEIRGPRHCRLSPDGDGALLTVSTMARSTWFGMGSAFDANWPSRAPWRRRCPRRERLLRGRARGAPASSTCRSPARSRRSGRRSRRGSRAPARRHRRLTGPHEPPRAGVTRRRRRRGGRAGSSARRPCARSARSARRTCAP